MDMKQGKRSRADASTAKAKKAKAAAETGAVVSEKRNQKKQTSGSTTKKAEEAAKMPQPNVSPHGSSNLDTEQVENSVRALLTHVARDRGGLLDDEAPVHVLLATKHMPRAVGKAKACKPVTISLPHPYISLDTADICLITKDPQREYKDKLAAQGLRAKVIGVSKLKKNYHPYEAKRGLLKAHDLFLADARVLPMLPPLLGKSFFEKRRLPVGVDLKKTDLRAELQRAACGAHYRHSTGTSNSVQIGTTSQPASHLVANIVSGLEQLIERLPGKWSNVQALQLRTTNSAALPFYNALPTA